MKTVDSYTNKRSYTAPGVEVILLDTEISLALASAPPSSGDEVNLAPEYRSTNPYNDHLT